MLQEICEHIHNYFSVGRYPEQYTIAGGTLSPAPALLDGQRFLITGSRLNDGMYTWHSAGIMNDDDTAGAGLVDETFTGVICGLAVPPQLAALAPEISEWAEKYGDVINSPYKSESFGGYSYTRADGGNATGGTGAAGWQEVFAGRLNRWRKVSF